MINQQPTINNVKSPEKKTSTERFPEGMCSEMFLTPTVEMFVFGILAFQYGIFPKKIGDSKYEIYRVVR